MITYKPLIETLKKYGMSARELGMKFNNHDLRERLNAGHYLNLETVDKICEILDCSITDVIGYEPGEQVIKTWTRGYIINWPLVKSKLRKNKDNPHRASMRMGKQGYWMHNLARNRQSSVDDSLKIAEYLKCDISEIAEEVIK